MTIEDASLHFSGVSRSYSRALCGPGGVAFSYERGTPVPLNTRTGTDAKMVFIYIRTGVPRS